MAARKGRIGVEVIEIDHVYIAVRDLALSEEFYDRAMPVLGFRKSRRPIGGDPHVHYYNRRFGHSFRPAGEGTPGHDPYAPGLHHFCFRVADEDAVDRAAGEPQAAGVGVTQPLYYPNYYATFFEDLDGVRLEVTSFRERRRRHMYDREAAG